MCDGGQVINHLFTDHVGIHHHIAEWLHFQYVFIADIACFDRITNSSSTHHRKVGTSAIHLGCQNQPPHIGLYKTHFVTIAFQTTIGFAYFHFQLRFAFVLERR
ncbi:Uncharacterised protein [Shigella sonnei]|nr:Uncharacterised protein [Shigella sonnei]